jgi:hypothetical protein
LLLRREAVTGGVDLRHRFDHGRYRVTASLAGSLVRGTADAIDLTQRNAVHYYNRPDAGLPYDPTRTSLTGTNLRVNGDKIAGTLTYGASYERLSPGFETNDIGFLSQADEQVGQVYAQVQSSQPRAFWRNASAQFYQYNQYTANGLPTINFTELDLYSEFLNRMTLAVSTWADVTGMEQQLAVPARVVRPMDENSPGDLRLGSSHRRKGGPDDDGGEDHQQRWARHPHPLGDRGSSAQLLGQFRRRRHLREHRVVEANRVLVLVR